MDEILAPTGIGRARPCDGRCEVHVGESRLVRVKWFGSIPIDWGYFWYCDNAVKEDEHRGFQVSIAS